MPELCLDCDRRGRADIRSDNQEDFLYADSDPAPKKENDRDEEIADTHANAVAKEKIFAGSKRRRITFPITEEKANAGSGGRGASGDAEEKENFIKSNAHAYTFTASKEENAAVAGTIRNPGCDSK